MQDAFAYAQTCQVFLAADVFVTVGANLGDGLSRPDALCPGDQYEIDAASRPMTLRLAQSEGLIQVAPESEVGQAGDAVETLATCRFMDDEAYQLDIVLLSIAGQLYALPLSPMKLRTPYTLLRSELPLTGPRLGDLLCLSFGRGTRITLADGEQAAIETLVPGDLVLTRDHGPRPLRWIGQATIRAIGSHAPVIITAETLGNAADLAISQQHRMFVYHREGAFDKAELLVQARHLVNGDSIFVREGSFMDYFALVFDEHEIIYAEGIPVESLMVTEATLARLPEPLQDRFPALRQHPHHGTEISAEAARALRPQTRE